MIAVHRRGFLGRLFGTAAALTVPMAGVRSASAAQAGALDDWTREVRGTHRCFFDFSKHMNGVALLHILNYLNTYATVHQVAPEQVGAVGTFYGIGGGSSISLAFNDAMWEKYELGDYTGLRDSAGQPYARNPFHRSTRDELHLLMQAMQTPMIPALADVVPALGIENLQGMGTQFLICANALGGWCAELEARGKGTAADLNEELRAKMLPGVTIVPAMVIAIEQAQAAGIAYNRQ